MNKKRFKRCVKPLGNKLDGYGTLPLIWVNLIRFLFFFLGTRETAFIYSILSAGVVHSVTQACTAGNLTTCTCDVSAREGEHTVEGWKWGGCSDNVKYGIEFSRQFVDASESTRSEKSENIRNRMNLHNNEVGRKVNMEEFFSSIFSQAYLKGVGSDPLKTSNVITYHRKSPWQI